MTTPNGTNPYPPGYVINFAEIYGITQAPAIAFVVIYFVILIICLIHAVLLFRKTHKVRFIFFFLSFYCVLREITFGTRAALLTDTSNVNLFTSESVFQASGFFALINVSYTLLKFWFIQAKNYLPPSIVTKIDTVTKLAYILLLGAVALGVAGGVMTATSGDLTNATGTNLATASKWIFFALTAVFLLITAYGIITMGEKTDDKTTILQKDVAILFLIGCFLNIKTCYNVASIYNTLLPREEAYFYPLGAVPEVIIVIIFCIPNIVKRFEYDEII